MHPHLATLSQYFSLQFVTLDLRRHHTILTTGWHTSFLNCFQVLAVNVKLTKGTQHILAKSDLCIAD